MFTKSIRIAVVVTAILFLSLPSSALNIRLYGKSGIVYNGEKVKICPSLTFNCCAIIHISWQDVKDFLEKDRQSIPAQVDVLNPSQTIHGSIKILNDAFFENMDEGTDNIGIAEDDVIEIIRD